MKKEFKVNIKATGIIIVAIFLFIIGAFSISAALQYNLKSDSEFLTRAAGYDTINSDAFKNQDKVVLHYDLYQGDAKVDEISDISYKIMAIDDDGNKALSAQDYIFTNTEGFTGGSVDLVYDYDAYKKSSYKLLNEFYLACYQGEGLICERKILFEEVEDKTISSFELEPYFNLTSSRNISNYTQLEEVSENNYKLNITMGPEERVESFIYNYHIWDKSSPVKDIKIASNDGMQVVKSETNTLDDYLNIEVKNTAKTMTGSDSTFADDDRKFVIEAMRKINAADGTIDTSSIENAIGNYTITFETTNSTEVTFNLQVVLNASEYIEKDNLCVERGIAYNANTYGVRKMVYPDYDSTFEMTVPFFVNVEPENGQVLIKNSANEDVTASFDIILPAALEPNATVPKTANIKIKPHEDLDAGFYYVETYRKDQLSGCMDFYLEKPSSIRIDTTVIDRGVYKELEDDAYDLSYYVKDDTSNTNLFLEGKLYINDKLIKDTINYAINGSARYVSMNKNRLTINGKTNATNIELLGIPTTMNGLKSGITINLAPTSLTEYSVKFKFQGMAQTNIPEEGAENLLYVVPTVYKDGKVATDVPYHYEIEHLTALATPSGFAHDIVVMQNEQKDGIDIVHIPYTSAAGTYNIRMVLDSSEAIKYEDQFILTYKPEITTDFYYVTINNTDTNIALPPKGYKNVFTIDYTLLKNGEIQTDTSKCVFTLGEGLEDKAQIFNNVVAINENCKVGDNITVLLNYDKDVASTYKTFKVVAADENNSSSMVESDDFDIEDGIITDESLIPVSVRISGFDSNYTNQKKITFSEVSGTSKQLSYSFLNADGVEFKNPQVRVKFAGLTRGTDYEVDYTNQKITVYANGLFDNRTVDINFTANGKTISSTNVILAKPSTYNCYMEFVETTFNRNERFHVSGSFINYDKNPKNVVLAVVCYSKDNQILTTGFDYQVVPNDNSYKDFNADILLPASTKDLKVKAFFLNGTDLSTANKVYAASKTITSSLE